MSTLYIVSTPIGNLGDVTHRAIDVLGSADRVLAEDTRRTSILFRRYGIATPLVSAHSFNEEARSDLVIGWLDAGETLALVSDAGTPLLADPGARIVRHVLAAGHDVVPVPGASSILAALVAAGIDPVPFTFFGFTPRAGRERQDRLVEIAGWPHAVVLFEAPRRLSRLLQDLRGVCGATREVAVARELTKLHETFVRGTLDEVVAYYDTATVRGEVVVVVAGVTATATLVDAAAAATLARELVAAGRRPSSIARELTGRLGITRNEAYEIALAAASEGDAG